MKNIFILFCVVTSISACTLRTNAPASGSNTSYSLDSVNVRGS